MTDPNLGLWNAERVRLQDALRVAAIELAEHAGSATYKIPIEMHLGDDEKYFVALGSAAGIREMLP